MLDGRGGWGGQPRLIADDEWAAPLRKHICMPQVDDSALAQTVDGFARAGQGPGVGVGCNNMAHAALRQQSGDYTAARSYIESQCGGRQWGLRQQVQVLAPIRRVHAVMNMYGLRSEEHTSELQSLMRIS